jgi:transposase
MRFIRDLNPETKKLLERISLRSKYYRVRDRAKCIILSYQGFSIKLLMRIFGVTRKTIYNWLTRWEDQGLLGLYDEKGRGRKSKFNQEQKEQIKDWVKEEPKRLNKILINIQNQWKIDVSKETITRIIKKLNMTWKRMKRGLSKKPQDWELEVKLPRLEELKEQDKKGEIDLRYLDESGFSLSPFIPYAWQEKGEEIILKSSQSKRINVLGLMNRKNELYYEIYSGTTNSETVINFLDKFSENLPIKTVIVLDQASIHTSDSLLNKLEEWKQKNLEIFWLPTYSPKLNLIEILWRFIKYEWIEVDAYNNWNSLVKYLKKVLNGIGKEYVINFV